MENVLQAWSLIEAVRQKPIHVTVVKVWTEQGLHWSVFKSWNGGHYGGSCIRSYSAEGQLIRQCMTFGAEPLEKIFGNKADTICDDHSVQFHGSYLRIFGLKKEFTQHERMNAMMQIKTWEFDSVGKFVNYPTFPLGERGLGGASPQLRDD